MEGVSVVPSVPSNFYLSSHVNPVEIPSEAYSATKPAVAKRAARPAGNTTGNIDTYTRSQQKPPMVVTKTGPKGCNARIA